MWISYATIALALVFGVLYAHTRSQLQTLRKIVLKNGFDKADAVMQYKVWPAEHTKGETDDPAS